MDTAKKSVKVNHERASHINAYFIQGYLGLSCWMGRLIRKQCFFVSPALTFLLVQPYFHFLNQSITNNGLISYL